MIEYDLQGEVMRDTVNTKSDHNVKYGLQVIMMCQCHFINCNKCTHSSEAC